MLSGPLIVRWALLWQLPEVTTPFAIDDVVHGPVPEDEDAFVAYAQITPLLRGSKPQGSVNSVEQIIANSRKSWDANFEQWLIENQSALVQYRNAGQLERAGGPSLATADNTTILRLHNDFRYFALIADAEALRLERAGELRAAWQLHAANLRCAIHAEQPGFPVCRMVGIMVRRTALRGITQWAEHPSLTREQLRAARAEVAKHAARRHPLINFGKAEYLAWRNTLNRPDAAHHLIPSLGGPSSAALIQLTVKQIASWTLALPDRSLRLLKQSLVNCADQLDVPMHERRARIGTVQQFIFERDPTRPLTMGQLEPQTLLHQLNSPTVTPVFQSGILLGMGSIDRAHRLDNARLAALDVALAAQEYYRVHQKFPTSLLELVPEFLNKVPFDPMSPTGDPLQYRLDENGDAVVWSLGVNEQPDSTDSDESSSAGGVAFIIRVPSETFPPVTTNESPSKKTEATSLMPGEDPPLPNVIK